MEGFTSTASPAGNIDLPLAARLHVGIPHQDMGILMMPVDVTNIATVPDRVGGLSLDSWLPAISRLFDLALAQPLSPADDPAGPVCYLTIDEGFVEAGQPQRRPGLHVDGRHGYRVQGVLMASSFPGCRVWLQDFTGEPGAEGNCSHLAGQCQEKSAVVLDPGEVWYLDGSAVHMSLPQHQRIWRQFVRLTWPGQCWHRGYTANPTGLQHTGYALPPRPAEFMRHRYLASRLPVHAY